MDMAPPPGLIYECFPLVGVVASHVVDRLLACPLWLEGVPGLQDKVLGYFVNEDHYLRRVARAVDFSPIERLCVARTPDRPGGTPPIPPLKLWKLYPVMFVLRIPSERELCRRAQADLAIRWFCGLGLLGSIPVHSTLSKFRKRMGISTFQEGFVCTLSQCVDAGLVPGLELAFDASKMLAAATPVERRNKHGVFPTDRLQFDEAGHLICPGQVAMIPGAHRARKGGTVIYRCPQPECALRAECTTRARRTVEINPQVHRQRQAGGRESSAEFQAAMRDLESNMLRESRLRREGDLARDECVVLAVAGRRATSGRAPHGHRLVWRLRQGHRQVHVAHRLGAT